ncbi:MAG: hypothetical protein ABC596_05740 [Candidatus Methanosuratincola petrocarbonis]
MIQHGILGMLNAIRRHVSCSVTYKRFKEEVYDPDTGTRKEFWETPGIEVIRGAVSEQEIEAAGGLVSVDDIWISFPIASFKKQEGETEDPRPTPGDEIKFPDNSIWAPIPRGGTKSVIYSQDPASMIFTVYLRRVS